MDLDAPELDAATADAIAGEAARASRHALPRGTPCPNCATPLDGPWCHACGQKAERYDRSILHLAGEAFEGLTHLDGRVWRTLPRLAVRPGQLTRDYLDGHRASQIPPFRLFLVALVAVFFAGGVGMGRSGGHPSFDLSLEGMNDPRIVQQMSAADRADMQAAAAKVQAARTASPRARWWSDRAEIARKRPEALVAALEQWGHRLAILMLPIAALMLSVLFAFRRGVFVFDHLVFSMHSLAFQGFLVSAAFLGGLVSDQAGWLLAAAPVHLFVHMRGTYRISVFGTLARMALLFVGSVIAVTLLLVGVLMLGLASLR